VGVAMPFAFAKRRAMGDGFRERMAHAAMRAINLILVGIAIDCITSQSFTIGFMRVLQQIAFGYFIAFFFVERSYLAQGVAAAVILTGYTAVWMLYPHNDPAGPWAMTNQNIGADFDQWLLGRRNTGYYVILNFIPSTATILFGVMCGRLVGSELPKSKVMGILALAGIGGIVLGLALGPMVPLIKRIWTASFALYAGGWTILFLLLFYWLVEVQGWRRWCTFFVVVGMNSIFAYTMAQIFRTSFFDRAIMVFTKPLAVLVFDSNRLVAAMQKPAAVPWPPPLEQWGVVIQATLVLLAEWGVLYWLYRRKIFFKL